MMKLERQRISNSLSFSSVSIIIKPSSFSNFNDNIVSTTLNDMSGITNLKQIVNACVDEITSRNYIHILKSTVKNA